MSLYLRILIVYLLITGLASYLITNVIIDELQPGVRQSTEDTLIDMSNLLAELVADEFGATGLETGGFSAGVDRFLRRSYHAHLFLSGKKTSSVRIYITDARGIVRYDSDGVAVGGDYSQWNDVYLTLRGEYGSRSTRSNPDDEFSSVMHVAAPIRRGEQIVGVLTVAKPNLSVQPFIDLAREKIIDRAIILSILSLLVAIAFSYWLTDSIRKLGRYSEAIGQGRQVPIPPIGEAELAKLAVAIDRMRRELEGREYVERYVHTLTHELKSPVSAIKGAAEILRAEMQRPDLARFAGNIQTEIDRIDEMINLLLALAAVEKQEILENTGVVDLVEVLGKISASKQAAMQDKGIRLKASLPDTAFVSGDRFLLTQALDNLLQNAIDFSPDGGEINLQVLVDNGISVSIRDQGPGIPEFARERIFERFYSLPRPSDQRKSSGLGLCFVKQIADLHAARIEVGNHAGGGVVAVLRFDDGAVAESAGG